MLFSLKKREQNIITKTVLQHIQEFEDAKRIRPDLFSMGFHEKQLSYKILTADCFYLVESQYHKTYAKQGQLYHEEAQIFSH